jgi:hypothetical protein
MGLSSVAIFGTNAEPHIQIPLQLSPNGCNEVSSLLSDLGPRAPKGFHGMSRNEKVLIEDGLIALLA